MKIKGTSVLGTLHFVSKTFPEQTSEWIDSLPAESKKIFSNPVISGQWFSFSAGMIVPMEKIGEMFYSGNSKKAASEMGKFSAEEGLKGIYKIFVKIASTGFVLRKTSQIFGTYYDGASIEVVEQTANGAVFKVSGIEKQGRIFFDRVSGWMEKTIEIVNNKPINVSYIESEHSDGTLSAVITASWQ